MSKAASSSPLRRSVSLASFTLMELLTVIAIIAILAAITLAAVTGVMTKAGRSRAASEIQAMSAGLENYKADNGAYPTNAAITGPPYSLDPSVAGGTYQTASAALYLALSGYADYYDTPVAGTKSYMTFKTSQLGNYQNGTGPTYVKDPWGFSYGYATGSTVGATTYVPYNGSGFFDLWSTGGLIADPNASTHATNTWVGNWQ